MQSSQNSEVNWENTWTQEAGSCFDGCQLSSRPDFFLAHRAQISNDGREYWGRGGTGLVTLGAGAQLSWVRISGMGQAKTPDNITYWSSAGYRSAKSDKLWDLRFCLRCLFGRRETGCSWLLGKFVNFPGSCCGILKRVDAEVHSVRQSSVYIFVTCGTI